MGMFEHSPRLVFLSLALLEAAVAWPCVAILKRVELRSLAGYATGIVLFLFAAAMPFAQIGIAKWMTQTNPMNDKFFFVLWVAESAFLVRIVHAYVPRYFERHENGDR